MAQVTVDSGPVVAADLVCNVPKEKWRMLMYARRTFVHIKVPYDCRELLRFVQEADEYGMWRELGFKSLEDFIQNGLEIDPELTQWAIEGLRATKPDQAVAFEKMVKVGKTIAEKCKVLPPLNKDGVNHTKEGGYYNVIPSDKQGNTQNYIIRRLKRDHPEILKDLESGKYKSARQAGIAAGFIKVPSIQEQIRKLYNKLTEEEKHQLIHELTLTKNTN